MLDFGYFVLIWWQIIKKQEILKKSCKDLFIWTELTIIWLIIGSDNVFKIEVNRALAIHVIVHNSQTQNWNRLKLDLRFVCGYLLIDDIKDDAKIRE